MIWKSQERRGLALAFLQRKICARYFLECFKNVSLPMSGATWPLRSSQCKPSAWCSASSWSSFFSPGTPWPGPSLPRGASLLPGVRLHHDHLRGLHALRGEHGAVLRQQHHLHCYWNVVLGGGVLLLPDDGGKTHQRGHDDEVEGDPIRGDMMMK